MNSNPSRPVLPSSSLPPGTKCPVCLEDIVNVTYANECLHYFCFECIDEWIREHNKCPICRRRIRFLCHNIRGPTDYDTRAVLPPLAQPDLMVQFGHNLVIVTTPPEHGLYMIYPERVNGLVFFRVEFLEQGRSHVLHSVDSGTLYVLPEDFEAVRSRLEDLGLQQYVPDWNEQQQLSKTNSRARKRRWPLFHPF